MFDLAERAHAVMLFDEADSLLSRRTVSVKGAAAVAETVTEIERACSGHKGVFWEALYSLFSTAAAGYGEFELARALWRKYLAQDGAEPDNPGESFAFETTLAGRNFARSIIGWGSLGYHVSLIFLSLPSADLAMERVVERVRQGGHGVPEEDVRRRFDRGREHFETLYKPLVDAWMLYDNAGEAPVLVASGGKP